MKYGTVMNTISSIPIPVTIKFAILFTVETIYNFLTLKNVTTFENCPFYDKISNLESMHRYKEMVCIITGGNDGIGYETALQLGKLGFRVIIACRNMGKARSAIKEMKRENSEIHVEAFELDLSDFKSVKKFVDIFKSLNIKLDLLVNNAGVYTTKTEYMPLKSNENAVEVEKTIVTNYLGTFLLTTLLLDTIKSNRGKIINITSLSHYAASANLDFTSRFDSTTAYCQSKLYLNMFTYQLKCLHPKLEVYCCHPGIVKTDIYRDMKVLKWILGSLNISKNILTGALGALYLALIGRTGKDELYYFDEKPMRPSSYCFHRDKLEELYQKTLPFLDLE